MLPASRPRSSPPRSGRPISFRSRLSRRPAGDPHRGLTFILPFLMFIFLLALGEDYNIPVMDTFIVRTVLVPCTVILLGRWNWWPSRLSRIGAQPGGSDGPGGEAAEQDTESAAPRAR